jgi:PGF-pre-PGF domain-containing protein
VRRIFDSNNEHFSNRILNKKLIINFIVILFVLELLFMPFTVASFTSSNDLGGSSKTADSGSSLPAVGDEPTDSGTDTIIKEDPPTDTDSGTTVVDDTSTDTNTESTTTDDTKTDSTDNTYDLNDNTSDTSTDSYDTDDISTDTIKNSLIVDENSIDTSKDSLYDDNNLDYAPNERIVSTDEIESKTESTLGDLTSGFEVEVKLTYSNDIESVKLTPSTDLEEVKVTVIKLKDKPEEIIDPPKKNVSIYKYMDIKLISNNTFIDEEEVDSLEFNFKVEKHWILDNNIDKATVRLIRYHDGVWQNLSTDLTSENDTCIFYKAASPGFSTFAVVGSKVIEKSESYGSDDMNIPWSIIIAFIMALTIMLVFILFKARYIYLKDENK